MPHGTVYIAAAIAITTFLLYLVTLAPTITNRFSGSDSADLASAVATWGIPHPTGYPLYVLLGGIVAHLLPIGQLAYRLNMLSAAASTGAAVLVFLTVLRLAQPVGALPRSVCYAAAATAALTLATARIVWSQSVLAEVYSLELLFAAAIAYLLAARPGGYWLWPLAGLAGLSLTHHTTIIFTLLGAAIVVMAHYRRRLLEPRLCGVAATLFVLPLLLYLLLPWRAAQHPASNWGDPSTLGRFVDVVTGTPYHYLLDRNPGDALRAVPAVVRLVFGQFAWWIVPLGVAGVLQLWQQERAYTAYLLTVMLLSAVWVCIYHAEGREMYLVQGVLALSISAGVGVMAGFRWLAEASTVIWRRRLPWAAAGVAVLTVAPWTILGLHDFNLRGDWSAWNYALATLQRQPIGGSVYTDSDETTFPLWYAQRAQGVRGDVRVIDIRFKDPLHQR